MSVAVKPGRLQGQGARLIFGFFFLFWKIVSQVLPALGTIVANSESLPLQNVFNFYQSAFTDM